MYILVYYIFVLKMQVFFFFLQSKHIILSSGHALLLKVKATSYNSLL